MGRGWGVQTFMISSQHLFSRVQAGSSWCGPFIYLYCLYEAMVTATSMIGSMTGLMIGIAPYENSMTGSKALRLVVSLDGVTADRQISLNLTSE